jgi:hypothetical protein
MTSGSRKRGRRKRRDGRRSPAQRGRPPVGWELQHNPYTAEGRIEGAYRFAVGAGNQTGWKRRVLIALGLLFPVGIGLALLVELVIVLVRWIR